MPPTKTPPEQPDWGLLPPVVRRQIKQREWDNQTNLKARLLGKRPFPIKINLKPPTGRRAIEDIAHYQTYVAAWRGYPEQHRIEWETRTYRDIGEQRIPRYLKITEIQDLILIIGAEAEAKSQHRAAVMTPLLKLPGDNLYPVMIKHLDTLDKMTEQESQRLKQLIAQLRPGMGAGCYLRALPLEGVDTKRLEQNQTIITDILDAQHAGAVTEAGGLHAWLDCAQNPTGWLWVRPLCPETQRRMGGLPIMQLPQEVLRQQALPAKNIIVVENNQAGLGLPSLTETIAVIGGGKNVAWMKAPWLQHKRVAYWGDIDTWGLAILSDVRKQVPEVMPLMMDQQTWQQFAALRVEEPNSLEQSPDGLTEAEQKLFAALWTEGGVALRLEQERLSADYSGEIVRGWIAK